MNQPAPVTQAAFDRLLQLLDNDRQQAGLKYEAVRGKLTNFFRWRGCSQPEDYVDRTIDRVARKLAEGAEVQTRDPYLYFHGVAVNVLREHWKQVDRNRMTSLDELPVSQSPAENPIAKEQDDEAQSEKEVRLECLDDCIAGLPRQQLEILTRYHQDRGGTKMAQRNELALSLNIPMNALRIRVFRVRADLERCIEKCMKSRKR